MTESAYREKKDYPFTFKIGNRNERLRVVYYENNSPNGNKLIQIFNGVGTLIARTNPNGIGAAAQTITFLNSFGFRSDDEKTRMLGIINSNSITGVNPLARIQSDVELPKPSGNPPTTPPQSSPTQPPPSSPSPFDQYSQFIQGVALAADVGKFIFDTLGGKQDIGIDLSEYGHPDSLKKVFDGKILKYPIDSSEQQDRLQITQYTYRPPYGDIFKVGLASTSSFFQTGAVRESALLKDSIGVVILPMPNGISDSNQTSWGPDAMGMMDMAAAGNIPELASGALATKLLSGIVDIPKNMTKLFILIKLLGGLSGGKLNPALSAAIQSFILSKAGFNVPEETILSRGYGVVANSNLELLFSGPSLRSFSFSYIMTPRSKEEAQVCRKIIRSFKQGMAPKKKNNTSGNGILLATPNVFKLEYLTAGKNGKSIKGVNKFKECALTNMSTSYAENTWAAYEEGQPARMQLSLTFKELQPVYNNDYADSEPDEIGY